jgi:hypothetical protein
VSKQIFIGAQAAAVPAAPPSAGLTAPDYHTLLTNNTVGQLVALASWLGF